MIALCSPAADIPLCSTLASIALRWALETRTRPLASAWTTTLWAGEHAREVDPADASDVIVITTMITTLSPQNCRSGASSSESDISRSMDPFYPPCESTLKDVDEIVAMSEFGVQIFQEGLPSRRNYVIQPRVNTRVFCPLPERDRLKSHNRFRGTFVIGCVAPHQSRKNIPALIHAFAML